MGVKASDSITLNTTKTLNDEVEATKKHFWADDDGAHVATVDGDATTGANVLIDSDGMYIREDTETVSSFSKNLINLGKASKEGETAKVSFFDGEASLGVRFGATRSGVTLGSGSVSLAGYDANLFVGEKVCDIDVWNLDGDALSSVYIGNVNEDRKSLRTWITEAISNYIASISNFKGIYAGSKVLTFSNSASCQLLSVDEMNALFNATDCSAENTAIAISNGDFGAMGSSTFNAFYANNAWHAHIGTTKTGVARINYIVVKF